jgi:hypothetical protein
MESKTVTCLFLLCRQMSAADEDHRIVTTGRHAVLFLSELLLLSSDYMRRIHEVHSSVLLPRFYLYAKFGRKSLHTIT